MRVASDRFADYVPSRPATVIPPELLEQYGETAAAIFAEPCPCDGCFWRSRCAERGLACAAFVLYVQGRSEARWSRAPRAATRERFDLVFGSLLKRNA